MSQQVDPLGDWLSSPAELSNSEPELFVIRLPIVESPGQQWDRETILGLLDEWETEQVGRFKFDRDRNRYLLSHVSLRLVLSRFLNCEPASVTYEQRSSQFVRPVLAKSHGSELRFSLSHSEELVAIAIADSGPIGIDIEPFARAKHTVEIASEYMAASEYADVQKLPKAEMARACLTLWTGKEAALKALDVGLAHPPEKVVFAMKDGVPGRLDHIADFLDQPPIDVTSVSVEKLAAIVSVAAAPSRKIGHLWAGDFSELHQLL